MSASTPEPPYPSSEAAESDPPPVELAGATHPNERPEQKLPPDREEPDRETPPDRQEPDRDTPPDREEPPKAADDPTR